MALQLQLHHTYPGNVVIIHNYLPCSDQHGPWRTPDGSGGKEPVLATNLSKEPNFNADVPDGLVSACFCVPPSQLPHVIRNGPKEQFGRGAEGLAAAYGIPVAGCIFTPQQSTL